MCQGFTNWHILILPLALRPPLASNPVLEERDGLEERLLLAELLLRVRDVGADAEAVLGAPVQRQRVLEPGGLERGLDLGAARGRHERVPVRGRDADRPRDGGDLGVLEQARVGGEPDVGAPALGQEPEAVPAAEAVAGDGDLGGAGRVAQVLDGGGDLGVGRVGPVRRQELRLVEARVVQVRRGGLAVEQVGGYRQEAGAPEAVREPGRYMG